VAEVGHQAAVVPQPARHHFDLVVGFGETADPLCRAARSFMDLE